MARITHVRKAQQRFATVPVIDPATGEQKRTPVMVRKKTFNELTEEWEVKEVQKTTKTGRAVFMAVTAEDRTKPKPLYTCDFCKTDIEVGTPYKHISPKSGPYGGRKLTRHEGCPTWQVWEYSSSMSARLAQISHDFWKSIEDVSDVDEVQSALDDAAEQIKEIAEEKRESASNIEDGFGHPTEKSEELESIADDLDNWADDISAADIPELPEPEERYYVRDTKGETPDWADANGYEDESEAEQVIEENADDDGRALVSAEDFEVVLETPEQPTEEQLDDWRSELQDALTVVDEAP